MSTTDPATFPAMDPPRPADSLWFLQVVEDHGTEEGARWALAHQREQEGFAGGRVYRTSKSTEGPWRAQGFYVDEPALKDSVMPDGLRRVLVLRSQIRPLGINETLFLDLLGRGRPEGVVVRPNPCNPLGEVSKAKLPPVDPLTAQLQAVSWEKVVSGDRGAAQIIIDLAAAAIEGGYFVSRHGDTWKSTITIERADPGR